MKLVIIDYNSGNVKSVLNAFNQIIDDDEIIISNDLEQIKSATHLFLPGVGAYGDCMDGLNKIPGLIDELKNQVLANKKPFLGICVGMQVLSSLGNENGKHDGLNFIEGEVQEISNENGKLKIPHMGWNEVELIDQNHPILKGIENKEHFYFANSYHFVTKNNVLGFVNYGQKINAIIAKENVIGLQFHPEKSGETGLKILKNFIDL